MIDVIVGYNLENNCGFLFGSSAKSGAIIGTILYEKLNFSQKENLLQTEPIIFN
jgi:hypothetical protein